MIEKATPKFPQEEIAPKTVGLSLRVVMSPIQAVETVGTIANSRPRKKEVRETIRGLFQKRRITKPSAPIKKAKVKVLFRPILSEIIPPERLKIPAER